MIGPRLVLSDGLRGVATFAVTVGVVLGACTVGRDDRLLAERGAQARSLAVDYYDAVRGGRADRGWNLIHPDMRATIFNGDRDRYIALAAQADWSRFNIEVGRPVPDDEHGTLYFIPIRVPGGTASVPAFLLAYRNFSLVPLQTGPALGPKEGTIAVRFDASGVPGIWPGGG